MSKLCFAVLLFCCVAVALHAQEAAATAEPSVEITAEPTPEPLVARSPETTTAPAPPPMRLSIAAAKKADGKPETTYASSTSNIFVRWRGENLPVGSVVRVAWIAEDVGDIVDPNFVIDRDITVVPSPTFSARFTISRPSDGWAPGKYRVDLFVDDLLRDTLGITIRD